MFACRGHILLSAEATVSGQDRVATARGRLLMRGGPITSSQAVEKLLYPRDPREGALQFVEDIVRQRGCYWGKKGIFLPTLFGRKSFVPGDPPSAAA